MISNKKKLTKEQLLIKLQRIQKGSNSVLSPNKERGHRQADALLLQYIHDTDIEVAFRVINKWYA